MRMVSSTLPMSMIDVRLTVKRIDCNSQWGHSTKLVVRYFVYYYTIWWTITDTGACVPRTKISSWPFTYAFTCYSNPLNVKCIICLFHLSCFKIHFHLLNVCCGKKCLNTCGSTCSAMIGREKRPEYVLRHQMLHSGRK